MSALSDLLLARQPAPQSSLEQIFIEEPPDLTTFVQDAKYMNNPPLSQIQYDAVRHIEQVFSAQTYELMVEGFGSYWEPVRRINFATLQFGKGCLGADEEIYDCRDGRWRRVSELADGPVVQGTHEVDAWGSTDHVEGQAVFGKGMDAVRAQGSKPFRRGRGQMVRVTTATGGSIEVYVGHLFASWASHDLPFKNRYEKADPVWVAAGRLQPGDRIAVMSKVGIENPVVQDVREVALVGYWIGDGSMPVPGNTGWGFFIDSRNTDLLDAYEALVMSYPGITTKHTVMRSGALRVRATGVRGAKHTPLLDIIRKWGLYGSRAWDKRVPEEFFSLPDDQLAVFLSALWDTDGSIYLKKTGSKPVRPVFEYSTVSEGLARDIQRLLLRFGVVARLSSKVSTYRYKGQKRSGRRAWRLLVGSGGHVSRLAKVLSLHGAKEDLRVLATQWEYSNEQQNISGDVYWDRVTSVEPLGEQEYWDLHVPDAGSYVAGSVAFLSSNSGKDHLARVAALRIASLMMCLRSPQEYFEMPAQDIISMLNVASNRSQAYLSYFKPLTKIVRTQKWFDDRCEVRQDMIVWDKNVEMISGHADAESQEGLNLILGVADEIDAFKTNEELLQYRARQTREPTKSAEAILKMLRTSASTRFEDYKIVTISYPRYLGSTIQQLTKDAKKALAADPEGSREYVAGPYATWEVNPRVKGKEQFAKDYEEDPAMAQTMYECRPVRAVNPYFRNEVAVREVVRQGIPLRVDYALETVQQVTGQGHAQVWVPEYTFDPGLVPMQGAQYVIHADLAIKADRAGVAMSHVKKWQEVSDTRLGADGEPEVVTEQRPEVQVDFAFGYEADLTQTPAREIQIRWVRALVSELKRRGFVIARVQYDGFQSADSMQLLNAAGIPTKRVSVDRDESAWRTLRDLMYEGRISIPESEDDLLVTEVLNLRKLINGKVDHPSLGSKDLADAVAGSVLGALEIGGSETGEQFVGSQSSISAFGGVGIDTPEAFRSLSGLSAPIMSTRAQEDW